MAQSGTGPISGGSMDVGSILTQTLAQTLIPALVGGSNTTTRRASKDANSKANQSYNQLTKPQDYTGQTQDILTQASQAFAPALATERAAGLYNSTTLEQLRNEATARATAASQSAILQDQTARAGAAAQLAGASMQANNTTVQEQAIDPMQALTSVGTAVLANEIYKGGKDILSGVFNASGKGAMGAVGAPAVGAASGGAFASALDSISSGSPLGIGAGTDLSGILDLNLTKDLTEPLTGAMSSGFGDIASYIMGGDFGGVSDIFGSAGGMPWLDIGTSLLSGDFGSAAATGIGYAFGGPVGGFIGNVVGSLFGCFLTTAVCDYMDLPDDNEYLNTLRKFRDEYVRPNYPELVEEYYRIAPAIVNYIKARPDADEVFKQMLNLYILPACNRIWAGDSQGAMETYINLVNFAKREGGIGG